MTKLRSSITPGTVLILLAGRFAGRRVVFLKQLESGLLLVTGPYKVNGVPVKRVDQAYVIATKTKIDISSISVDANITDATFKKADSKRASKKASMFAKSNASENKTKIASERKAIQASLDAQLVPILKKTPMLKSYMATSFSLKKGQTLHSMKF
jgi:large subunit ribosomal protein L6e